MKISCFCTKFFCRTDSNFPCDKYGRFDLDITHEWSWVQSRIQVWQKGPSSSCWSLVDSNINAQDLLRQFGLRCNTCCFGHFELKRKQKVSWVGRDIVGWFVRNVVMPSLEYKWQNWQYIKKKQDQLTISPQRQTRWSHVADHSRPQSPRSFWPVAGIESSGLTRFSEYAQSIRFVFSTNQICQIWREVLESRTSGIGPSQARRIVGSGDENGRWREGDGGNACAVNLAPMLIVLHVTVAPKTSAS